QSVVAASVRSLTSSLFSMSMSGGTAGSPAWMRARLALPLTAGSGFGRSAMRLGTAGSGGVPLQETNGATQIRLVSVRMATAPYYGLRLLWGRATSRDLLQPHRLQEGLVRALAAEESLDRTLSRAAPRRA